MSHLSVLDLIRETDFSPEPKKFMIFVLFLGRLRFFIFQISSEPKNMCMELLFFNSTKKWCFLGLFAPKFANENCIQAKESYPTTSKIHEAKKNEKCFKFWESQVSPVFFTRTAWFCSKTNFGREKFGGINTKIQNHDCKSICFIEK